MSLSLSGPYILQLQKQKDEQKSRCFLSVQTATWISHSDLHHTLPNRTPFNFHFLKPIPPPLSVNDNTIYVVLRNLGVAFELSVPFNIWMESICLSSGFYFQNIWFHLLLPVTAATALAQSSASTVAVGSGSAPLLTLLPAFSLIPTEPKRYLKPKPDNITFLL